MMMKILIVEDDPFLQKALITKFSREGYEILDAKDGNEAIEKARLGPDIVLLDLMLPKKSGFEVLMEFKKTPTLEKLKVVILSNLGQKDDIQRSAELGAVDYLVKAEARIDDIVKKVKAMVEKKE